MDQAFVTFKGETGELLRNVTERFLLGIAETDPAILSVFRDRDVKPYRDLLAWSGEFPGKYLTGCAYVYRASRAAEGRAIKLTEK